MRAADLIQVSHENGIHLPEPDLWLDPHFSAPRAFVSHAHSDHIARHRLVFCSQVTRALMHHRFGKLPNSRFRRIGFDRPMKWRGFELRLLPAGHIIGSAMLHLTRLSDGATLLYTGDYKLRQGLSTEGARLLQADTLIMETTFGLPRYEFPPAREIAAGVLDFVRRAFAEGAAPMLLGYSLGKAQEILALLAQAGHPVMLHPNVMAITDLLRPHLPAAPGYKLFDPAEARGHVLVFPPHAARQDQVNSIGAPVRTAMLSGWALDKGAKYRFGVDEAFPLSDHADYPDLLRTVEEVRPRRIYTVHGHTREFAADLRRRGHDAWALGREEQLELSILAQPA